MWTTLLMCSSVIVDGSVGMISDWKVTRSNGFDVESRILVKRSVLELEYYIPNGSDTGYYTGRKVACQDLGNGTEWLVQDGPNLKKLKYEHRFNLYDLEKRKLIDGIPVFVRAEDGDWYKIVDPPEAFKEFVTSKLDFYYVKENSLTLSTADFKPANVTDLYNTYKYHEDPDYNVTLTKSSSSVGHNVERLQDTLKKIVRRSADNNEYYKPINSSVGYYTGRNVTDITKNGTINWYKSESEGNLSIWFVIEARGALKNIVHEHRLNIYESTSDGLVEGYPVFVRTDEGKWYKILDPVIEFRRFLSRLPYYLEEDNLVVGPEDYKPAILRFNDVGVLETVVVTSTENVPSHRRG